MTADADLPMTRRAFGLKASYTAAFDGGQAPGEGGAGQFLFRQPDKLVGDTFGAIGP